MILIITAVVIIVLGNIMLELLKALSGAFKVAMVMTAG